MHTRSIFPPKRLVLASSSPYRAQILNQCGIPFVQSPADIDETPRLSESPAQYVARLAFEKAEALACAFPDDWIIGSDQTCILDGEITGKPGSFERAFHQLKRVQGHRVTFLTGLTLLQPSSNCHFSLVEPFHVHFRQLSDDELTRYLHAEKPYDCAGSFKVEGLGIHLFEQLEGRDYNSLIGLPLIGLNDLLRQAGISSLAMASKPSL